LLEFLRGIVSLNSYKPLITKNELKSIKQLTKARGCRIGLQYCK